MSRYLVNLKKGNDYLVPKVFGGMDITNVLASQEIASGGWQTFPSYTATQDCIVCVWAESIGRDWSFKIDGVQIFLARENDYGKDGFNVLLKTGQTLTGSDFVRIGFKIFGLKY